MKSSGTIFFLKKLVVNIIWECDFPVAISAIENKIREMFVIIISDLPKS